MRIKKSVLTTLTLSVVALASAGAADDLKFGVRTGFYTEVGDPFIGAEVLVPVARSIYFNPNFEYVFTENLRYFTANADFHYDLLKQDRRYVWVGAGLALATKNPDGPLEGDTDPGLNLLAGIGFKRESVIPYFQFKLIAKEDTEAALAFGLRF
jgi:hypothetical protein